MALFEKSVGLVKLVPIPTLPITLRSYKRTKQLRSTLHNYPTVVVLVGGG